MPQTGPKTPLAPVARRKAMQLLKAIHEKTGGRGRGVRDVTELESGLTPEESRGAWTDLLSLGLIERFSQEFTARLSPAGVDFIDSGRLLAESTLQPANSRKVFIVRGYDTGAREAVAQFVEEIDFRAIMLDDPAQQGRTIMEQVEAHGEADFAIVLLAPSDLGSAPSLHILMELGYFLGRLGRTKVCALAIDSAMNLPADLAGVVLESFDPSGGWKSTLRRKLHGER